MSGRDPPPAYAVTCPSAVVFVTVTLRTTALAPAGIPELPATFTRVVPRPTTLPAFAPVPSRVSSSRVGACGVNLAPAVANAIWLAPWMPLATSVTVTFTTYSPTSA